MITDTTIQEYYNQSKRWQSELEFYEVEVRVLHQLFDKHIDDIHTTSQTERLGALLNDLYEWSVSDKVVADELKVQLQSLAGMLNDDAAFADDRLTHNQDRLATNMDDFRCEYQQLKAGIYKLMATLLPEVTAN